MSRKKSLILIVFVFIVFGLFLASKVFTGALSSPSGDSRYKYLEIPLSELSASEIKMYEKGTLRVFAYLSGPELKPIVLEGYVKYEDVDFYRQVSGSQGIAHNGAAYEFVEPGRGGWFNKHGVMVTTERYSGRMMQLPYKTGNGVILVYK